MKRFKITRNKLIIFLVFLVLLIGSIYWRREDFASAFTNQGWAAPLALISECIVFMILWFISPFKKIFGEGKGVKRRPLHFFINWVVVFVFLLPFIFLYFNGFLFQENQISTIAQVSVIGISITLAGLLLSSARISQITPQKRQELMCVSQKFIMVAVLSIFSVASISLIYQGLGGININVFTLEDTTNIYRGILFWFATPCLYISLVLFLVGLVDTVFVFFNLDTRPTVPR